MAKETNTELFLNTDMQYPCTILNEAEDTAIDITSWALSWLVKRRLSDTDANAIITKTTSSGIALSGSFNADPAVNTQVATVTIEDSDTVSKEPGLYFYELKRTDAGFETVLIYGRLQLKRSVHTS